MIATCLNKAITIHHNSGFGRFRAGPQKKGDFEGAINNTYKEIIRFAAIAAFHALICKPVLNGMADEGYPGLIWIAAPAA